MREDRKWGVLHRIWSGTHLLIWGDPLTAAAYSRAFSFCGSDGVEMMEPLSFKGRRGSGIAGGRCAYSDKSLNPCWDWQKYTYSYRVWGRHLYNPKRIQMCGVALCTVILGLWGRILKTRLRIRAGSFPSSQPRMHPLRATYTYWPEIYLNHSLIDAAHPGPYTDSPIPRVFGTVSPLDQQLFYSMDDFADDLLKGERSGKYTPIEVSHWLENYAAAAAESLARGERRATRKGRSEYRRLTIDIAFAIGLGRFFAAKFRAGVLYRIFEQTGDCAALEEALKAYKQARDAWTGIAVRTKGVYMRDITVGEARQLRGHWADRLADIDADIAAVAAKLESARPAEKGGPVTLAIAEALGRTQRSNVKVRYAPVPTFQSGYAFAVELVAQKDYVSVRLYYRHVNQAERWESHAMNSEGRVWRATIPAEYTQSPFPLQYYFELREEPHSAVLYPGLGDQLTNQPYFAARRA